MPANERGGLKAAFTNFNRVDTDKEAELKLLGRTVERPADQTPPPPAPAPAPPIEQLPDSYHPATSPVPASPASTTGLTPRPLLHREVLRQLSFRCPLTLAAELRKKAAFNQLEQQQIIVEGIRRVLAELPEPPAGWEG
jgi:hypothetical protein